MPGPTGRRRGKVVDWAEISRHFGPKFVSDVRRALEAMGRSKGGREADRAMRHLLHALATDPQPAAAILLKEFVRLSEGGRGDGPAALMNLVGFISSWMAADATKATLRSPTIAGYASAAGYAFEALAALPDRSYPRFQRRMITIPDGEGNVTSLGSLDWPEFEGLQGVSRERRALELVREAAVEVFERAEALFLFGQDLLQSSDPHPGIDPRVWSEIRGYLFEERACWLRTERSLIHPSNIHLRAPSEWFDRWADRRNWERAGLDPRVAGHLLPSTSMQGRRRAVGSVVAGCIGPSQVASVATMVVICCDTGWNRQPIVDMPRQPFLYRTAKHTAWASTAFITSYKRRAGHEVLAFLDGGAPGSDLFLENLDSLWRETVAEVDPSGELQDGYRLLDNARNASTLEIIDRYRAVTDAVREFDREKRFADRSFFYLTGSHGIGCDRAPGIRQIADGGILARPGVTFQAIRKTYLNLRLREVGSVGALRAQAGHRDWSVLMPHYLNTVEVRAELDENIRFHQNACQAILVDGRPGADIVLRMSDADLEWYSHLARACGIAVAAGLVPTASRGPDAAILRFQPHPENLEDLYLTHLALRRAWGTVSPTRWNVQVRPLLAVTKAIGREACRAGLGRAYRDAARRAHRGLSTGATAVPVVLGS